MELKPIELNIDRSQEIYSSTNCQLVLDAIIESYTRNGFNKPIKISKSTDTTITATAKTAQEHNASTKILQKNGFAFPEIIKDDEIGNAWLWTLHK